MLTQEIKAHTGLRGVASLCVVLHHYRANLSDEVDIDKVTHFFSASGSFVDLFFVLSGFIMAACYAEQFQNSVSFKGVLAFLRKRIARIYPLHLATLLVMAVFMLRGSGGLGPEQYANLAENLLLVQAWGMNDAYVLNFPSWSVSAEWMLYLLFPALVFAGNHPFWRIALLALAGLAYLALFAVGGGLELQERLSLWRAIPAFVLGMALFDVRAVVTRLSAGALALVQIVSAAGGVIVMHAGLPDVLLIPCFAALVLTTWQDKGPVAQLLSSRVLLLLGLVSYSIYLLHVPVRMVMYQVWGKLFVDGADPLGGVLFVATCLIATILCGFASFYAFETPLRRWINGR